jgi:small subunit ribosomal protein S17
MADDEKKDEVSVPGTEDAETTEAPELEVPGSESDAGDEPEAPEAEASSDAASEATAESDSASEAQEEVTETAESDSVAAPAPVKKQRKLKHVPRSQRRTRTAPKREASKERKPITRIPKPEGERADRQERRGVVVSDKGDKTIIVKVDVVKLHPKYKKVIRQTTKFHAHDEQNTAGVGDTVRIVETRPLSKTKHWRLAEVVEKAK